MNLLSLVILPALLSFMLKAVILFCERKSLKRNNFTTLLYICTLQSLCEVITFFSYMNGSDVELLFRLYYILIVWWLAYALIYIVDVLTLSNRVKYFVAFIASGLSIVLLFSDLIISDYYSIQYSITAVKEQYYWMYQVFVLGIILSSIAILLRSLFWPKNIKLQTQSYYLFIALIIPFVTIIGVTLLMQAGYQINMLMILPVATLLFVVFVVKCEKHHELVDIRRLLPWSKENKFASQMNLIASRCSLGEISLKEANNEFQRLLLEYQKDKGKNKNQAAKSLGISRSTLYAKLDTLNII